MITLSNYILQKVLSLVLLKSTGPEVYVATMTTFLPDSYNDLELIPNNLKGIKLKSNPGDNVTDFYAEILV